MKFHFKANLECQLHGIAAVCEHGPISPEDIQELLLEKLPESLVDARKRARIRNLTYDLAHRRETIVNMGGRGESARWQIRPEGQAKAAEKELA